MYWYMRCEVWQLEPKSMTLTAERFGWQSRMFSGLRSQWITSTSPRPRKARALSSCLANLRTRLRLTPPSCVLRSSS